MKSFKRILSNHRLEIYFFPVILTMFFISYHYYHFYENDFGKISQVVKPSIKSNNYDLIQRYHPYYQIYQLAKEVKNPEVNVIYLRTKANPKNKQYLHELNIMIDYFFYPHIIKSHPLNDLLSLEPRKGQIIISDYDLSILSLTSFKFQPLIVKKKDLSRINRRPEDDFFVYEVI